jgi:hypothetical protein
VSRCEPGEGDCEEGEDEEEGEVRKKAPFLLGYDEGLILEQ